MKAFRRSLVLGTATLAAVAALGWGLPSSQAAPSAPSDAAFPAATIQGEQFVVHVTTPPVAVGAAGQFRVKVQAKDGFKFNEQFPTKLKLSDPPSGLEFPKRKLKKGDGSLGDAGKSFTFDVPVKATRAGSFPFEAVLKFSVCNDSKCVVKRQKLKSAIVAQ